MKHLFVPYELALKLKEKGFDEPCLSKYSTKDKMDIASIFGITNSLLKGDEYRKYGWICTAPLYQQVIDWFREKHEILVFADTTYDFSCHTPTIHQKGKSHVRVDGIIEFRTYYEALNKAIEEALKLI